MPSKIAIVAITVFIAAASVNPSLAEQKFTVQDAAHEISSEAAQCRSYYGFAQQCADNAGRTTLSSELQHANDLAGKLQFVMGKSAGMSNEAMLAFLKLTLEADKESISNSCVNISVLILKYAKSCKVLLEHPEIRLQTLLGQVP